MRRTRSTSFPASPESARVLRNVLAPNDQAVGKLLAKRVGKTSSKLDVSVLDSSAASSGCGTPKKKPNASVVDCVELCRLLLEKVGADSQLSDTAELDRVLTTEYPPGVADLLGRITGALDTDGVLECVSDISDSSDDESVPLIITSPVRKSVSELFRRKECASRGEQESEIAISRIFQLGKFCSFQDPSIPATAPYVGNRVVTMSGFGELGRFGNQVFQYAFLKAYASLHAIPEIQVPYWIGANLFGLDDPPVARAFPAAVEFDGTVANSTFTDELLNYARNLHEIGGTTELNPSVLEHSGVGSAPHNVDVWGWFQWHSSVYEPFKEILRTTFTPIPSLDQHLGGVFDREVRNHGGRRRTVVGVHLRYGDYQSIAASSFGYCAPTSWYIEWLDELWPTLDDPVLLVTSDDLKSVIDDFAKFHPVTTSSVEMHMPESFEGMKAGFFPDWYSLTQCDIIGISNSTFSFSASLMNARPNFRVFRAHFRYRMVEISAWDADPIVHRDVNKNRVAHALETLGILYNTQGCAAVFRNVLYELPCYCIRSLVMKAVFWYNSRYKLGSSV